MDEFYGFDEQNPDRRMKVFETRQGDGSSDLHLFYCPCLEKCITKIPLENIVTLLDALEKYRHYKG